LGMSTKAIGEIKSHAWFDGFDWAALKAQRIRAPYIPNVKRPDDASHFDQIDPRDPRLRLSDDDRAYESDGEFANF